MQNILFIGGAGFIGSNLIKQLTNNVSNYQIFVLEPQIANLDRLKDLNTTIINGNIKDILLIERIIVDYKISIIVHLVSTLLPNSDYEEYKQEFENVIFPTYRIVKLCAKHSIKIIYFSSGGTIYGNRNNLTPFKENDKLEPISYYGLSKLIIEEYIIFEHRINNVEYLILRPSNPYGNGQNLYGKQGLIAVSIGKILSNIPIEIYGDGNQIRDYIFIDDFAKIFHKLLDANISNTILNIGSGKGYSVKQVIEFISQNLNRQLNVNIIPSRTTDVSNVILDTTKLQSLIPYDLTSLEIGIKSFIKSVIKN